MYYVLLGINYEADLSLTCVDRNINILPGTNPRDCILDLKIKLSTEVNLVILAVRSY